MTVGRMKMPAGNGTSSARADAEGLLAGVTASRVAGGTPKRISVTPSAVVTTCRLAEAAAKRIM